MRYVDARWRIGTTVGSALVAALLAGVCVPPPGAIKDEDFVRWLAERRVAHPNRLAAALAVRTGSPR